MNTTDTAFACATILTAGGIGVAGYAIRKAAREAMWGRYALRITVSFAPVQPKTSPPAAAAVPPAQPAVVPRSPEPPVGQVIELADMSRAEAARLIGVSERTIRRRGKQWGLEEIVHPGRETKITAVSVFRYVQAREAA